jgi:hypothetical protein
MAPSRKRVDEHRTRNFAQPYSCEQVIAGSSGVLEDEGSLLEILAGVKGIFGEEVGHLDTASFILLVEGCPVDFRHVCRLAGLLVFVVNALHFRIGFAGVVDVIALGYGNDSRQNGPFGLHGFSLSLPEVIS